jgi:hypothetical protein
MGTERLYMDTSRFASKNHFWFLGTTANETVKEFYQTFWYNYCTI